MTLRSAFLAAVLAATFLFQLADVCFAASLGEIKSRGEIIVGVKDNDPPFGYRDPSGELIGLELDLAKDIAARLGVKMTPFAVSATSRLQFLPLGKIDLVIATLAVTPHRERVVRLVKPYYYASQPALLPRRGSRIKSLSDLKGQAVCTILNAYYNEALSSQVPDVELVPFRSFEKASKAFGGGRCAALAEHNTRLIHLQQKHSGERAGSDLIPIEPEPRPWAIAVRPREQDADLAAFLSGTIRDWHKNGKLVALEKKWLGRNTPWIIEMHEKLK